MTAEVSIRFSDGRVQRLTLPPGKYLVGRDAGDIVLSDPGVSTRHAELEVRADAVTLTDLGSTNGTFEGDARLSGPQTMAPDRPLRLGGATLSLLRAEVAAAAAPRVKTARSLKFTLMAGVGVATLLTAAWVSLRLVRGLLGDGGWDNASSHLALAGFRLGMTPDEAVSACSGGDILFDHEHLVKEPESPPLFNANGVYVGGDAPKGFPTPPDPGIARAWWDTKSIDPPAGGYMAHMRCLRSDVGHRQLEFTRPPDARLSKITHRPPLADPRPTLAAYQDELVARYGAFVRETLFNGGKRHLLQWKLTSPAEDCRAPSATHGTPRAPTDVWDACLTTKLWAMIDTNDAQVTSAQVTAVSLELESNAEERAKFNRIGPNQ